MKKVRVLSLEENDFKPSVVTFPQNHPSKRFLTNNEDDVENNDLIEFDLYHHKTSKNRSTLYGHNDKFDWLGKTTVAQNKAQGSKYVLGFYSKDSKNITLIEADNIFNLEQHSKNEKAEEDEVEQQKPLMRAIEQKKLLVEEFGNTRSKKMIEAYKTSVVTESKISEANEIRDILLEKAEKFEKSNEENKEDPRSAFILSKREMLPEFNLDAQEPEQVYNFDSIISKEEWEGLSTKEFAAAANKEGVLEKGKKYLSRFVAQELEDIKNKKRFFKGAVSFSSKLKCLVYLNWLLKFLEMRAIHKEHDKLCEEMRMHQNNLKSILSKFFIASNRDQEDKVVFVKNSMLTDKLICYILILALFYGDFELDATTLIANMKIEPKKFPKYLDEIGGVMKKKKEEGVEKVIISLKAPLKFEPPKPKKLRK